MGIAGVVGIAVVAIIIAVAAYFAYRWYRSGGLMGMGMNLLGGGAMGAAAGAAGAAAGAAGTVASAGLDALIPISEIVLTPVQPLAALTGSASAGILSPVAQVAPSSLPSSLPSLPSFGSLPGL